LFCDRSHLAVDIGANMGEYSYYMAKFARKVVSFEPNFDLWPHLRLLLGCRIRLEGAALSNHSGNSVLRYVEDNTGVATIETKNDLRMIADRERIKTRQVEQRTLDSFDFSGVSFIKIDVEGHEEAVIEGAGRTLARNQPVLLIESENRHNPGAPDRLKKILAKQGYIGFYLKGSVLVPIAQITEDERDVRNLSIEGKRYVNNYLFFRSSDADLIARVHEVLRALTG
jgi:FkbM family methyltransferase